MHPAEVTIAQATDYVEAIRDAAVEVDSTARKEKIVAEIETEASRRFWLPS
ncbi:MAG: hypothetical protein AAF349_17650 [Cyanobacteria bacterium P01_A01_bin.68]